MPHTILTEQELVACDWYLKLGSPTQALRRAGYEESYIKQKAASFFDRDLEREYIETARKKMEEKHENDLDDILATCRSIMNDPEKSDSNRLKAADTLAKIKGIYNQPERNKSDTPKFVGEEDLLD